MELSENARTVLERRYLRKENGKVVETPEEMFRRVAENIAMAEENYDGARREEWAEKFYELMTSLDFMPNSPTLMNAGRELQQLAACFVLPVEDSMEQIFDSIKHAALIFGRARWGGSGALYLQPAIAGSKARVEAAQLWGLAPISGDDGRVLGGWPL